MLLQCETVLAVIGQLSTGEVFGSLAHPGEHPFCTRKVIGSSPMRSTVDLPRDGEDQWEGPLFGLVAELADASASKADARKGVRVQFPPWLRKKTLPCTVNIFLDLRSVTTVEQQMSLDSETRGKEITLELGGWSPLRNLAQWIEQRFPKASVIGSNPIIPTAGRHGFESRHIHSWVCTSAAEARV